MEQISKGIRTVPLSPLLEAIGVERAPGARAKLDRQLTEKELNAFGRLPLSGRGRYLVQRRTTDDGQLLLDGQSRARRAKAERFKDAEFINTAPAGPGCNWLSVGPRNINGRIKSLAIHPTNNQVLYAGSADGGVWKTTDGGQSWRATMHDEGSLAIGAIAIDPNAPDTVYAGTGEAVYRFSGGGPLPPGSPRIAWFYEGVGVFKSTDGGNSWSLTGAHPNDFVYRIAVDPFDSQHVLCAGYATAAGAGGLARSRNGGATWTTVATGIFTELLFDPNTSGRVYAGQYNGGVLKSTDGGASWTARNTGLPAVVDIGRVSLSIAKANANVLYAKIEDDATGGLLGVYRTASAGEAPGWSLVGDPGVDGGFLWWYSHIAADPTDATGNIVWVGGVNVARSGDGGTTWDLVSDAYNGTRPPTHADQHALVFDPSDSNTVYIANDGGVFRGVFTGGALPVTWTKVSTGLVVTQFYDLDASPVVRSMFGGGAQDNGSMVSTGGQSWRHVLGGDGGYVAFHPSDPHTFYVQSQNANIERTTDGGATFVPARSGIKGSGVFPATVMAIDPGNPLILFAGTDRVFRTTNGGVGNLAWSKASAAIGTVTEIAIAPSSSAVVYAGTLAGRLYRATDGGITATSFVDVTPPVTGFPTRWLSGITVHPSDANTVYVTFLGFNGSEANASDHVWKGSFDSATSAWTWTLKAGGLPDVPVGGLAFDPATGNLYLATDVGVFRSTDDGVSWWPFEVGLPNTAVVDLALDPVRNVLRAATHGRGMYQLALNGACPDVDIYLRDNLLDTGEVTPSPSGVLDPTTVGRLVRHYQSVDIKVDAPPFDTVDALVDGVEFDNPDHPFTRSSGAKIEDIAGITHNRPIRAQTNRVYVQVHNRGWKVASSVTVKVLYADAGAGLPALPNDFWPAFPGDAFDQTHWKPIGTTTITDLLPNVPRVLSWDWMPPATTSDHVCLLAMIDSPQDPLLPLTELNVDNLTLGNKRVTHRNVQPMDAPTPSGGGLANAWTSLYFSNGMAEHKFFDLRIENLTEQRCELRMILPAVQLREDLAKALTGFRARKLRKDELRQLVKIAREEGVVSDYVAKLATTLPNPILLEVIPGNATAELRGVLIPPGKRVPAVLTVACSPEATMARSPRFEVTQYVERRLIGGSEFIFNLVPTT